MGNLPKSKTDYESIKKLKQFTQMIGMKIKGVFMIKIQTLASENPITINVPSLVGAKLDGMDFHRAILNNSEMMKSSLRKVTLRNAELCGANLSEADLSYASLVMCLMDGAILNNAQLSNTTCYHASFKNAELSHVNLTDAKVKNANFEGALLFGAVLECEGLDEANLNGAAFDDLTIWPQDFQPLNHGAIHRKS